MMTFLPQPYHYLWHDLLLFSIGLGIAILAIIVCFIKNPFEQEIYSKSNQPFDFIRFPQVVLITTLIFLVFQSLIQYAAPLMATSDEYCRAYYAYSWSRDPFFATADHIWLSGQFYVIGTFYRLFGNLEFATRFSSLIGAALVAASATNLGAIISKNRFGAIVSGLLAGMHWIVLWSSTSAMSEVFFYPAILIAMNFWVAAWHIDRKTEPMRQEWFLFFSALFVGIGNMFRYESWYFGVPFGIYLIIRLVLSIRKGNEHTNKTRLIMLASMVVIALYPCGHVLSAWITMGSPFASISNNIQMNEDTNLFYSGDLWSRVMTYPSLVWTDHWYFLPTMIGGLIICLIFGKKEKWLTPYHLALGIVFLFSIFVSAKSGVGSNIRPRYSTFFILLLTGYSSIAIRALATIDQRLIRMAGTALILVFSTVIIGNNYVKALTRYPNDWNINTADSNFIVRIKLEHNLRYNTGYETKIHPKDFILKMYSLGDPSQLWAATFHSHQPDNVSFIWTEEQFLEAAKSDQENVSFAVKTPYPNNHGLEEHYEKVMEIDGWDVWQSKK